MDPPSLNFARGKDFQRSMRQKFGHPVVFSPGFRQREFTLVVSFCRARFRLDCHTVSITLQSCFGGYPQGFRVLHLKERTFKFSVASTFTFSVYMDSTHILDIIYKKGGRLEWTNVIIYTRNHK